MTPDTRSADVSNGLPGLELWGGHECTVNRVGDAWFDQTPRSGHEERIGDLALFAGLGIRKLRYPALWERIAPLNPQQRNFAWTDERLPEIRRLGMEPILTLCHHGSGPHYTSLLDDSFAPGLARHAAAVAERYPWVDDYTPVNEPLTTARFSALYGYWYPHARDERACWLALLNEIDATRLSMHAIRRINRQARLIQTDDLGFCHATAPLAGEAEFQNHRRWMGWDLLCGMVVPGHPLWERLVRLGFGDRLRVIADDPCPPDVIGINHYLSSERLLDDRLELHRDRGLADSEVGECDGVAHVDVDAQRSVPDQVVGLLGLVEQAWQRYRRPIAITECHHGATRDEQARWFIETWHAAEALREIGVDLRAVTAWSLLGSHDWNRMVTRQSGHYEPGVFDIRSGTPRPTLMARVLQDLSAGRHPVGPGLEVPGWWHNERRSRASKLALNGPWRDVGGPAPLLIVGKDDALLDLTTEACEARGLHYLRAAELHDRAIATARPWAILDIRDWDSASPAQEPELSVMCRRFGVQGAVVRAHDTRISPAATSEDLFVVTTGPVFFPSDDAGLAARILDALNRGDYRVFGGEADWNGVYGPCLVDTVLDLLLDGATGEAHFLADRGWSAGDLARALAGVVRREPKPIPNPESASDASPTVEVSYIPPIESVLERFVMDRRRARTCSDVASVEYHFEAAE